MNNSRIDTELDNEAQIPLCPKCKTPKAYKVHLLGKVYVMPINCKCEREAQEALMLAQKQRQETETCKAQMKRVIGDNREYWNCTFANDDGLDAKHTALAKEYVKRWPEMLKKSRGLILYGDTGTGKTYLASCIANALLSKGIAVCVASLPDLIDALLRGNAEALSVIKTCPLLVLDDLGAESESQFRIEKTFQIINARVQSNLPMIITTNILYSEMHTECGISRRRIYQRIISRCIPVEMTVERRAKQAKALIQETKEWGI